MDELKNNEKVSVEEQKSVNESKDNRKPIAQIRSGQVTVSVWENKKQNSDGSMRVFHTLSFQKSYKDKGGEWHNISSFLVSDLSHIAFASILTANKLDEA